MIGSAFNIFAIGFFAGALFAFLLINDEKLNSPEGKFKRMVKKLEERMERRE